MLMAEIWQQEKSWPGVILLTRIPPHVFVPLRQDQVLVINHNSSTSARHRELGMQFLWFAIILRVHPPFHPSFHSHLLTRPTRVIMCAVKLQKQTRSRVDSGQWIWGKQGWIVAIYMKYELVSRKGHKLNRGRVGVETWGSEKHLSLFSDADTISTISMSTIVALDKLKRLIWMVIIISTYRLFSQQSGNVSGRLIFN